MNVVVSDSHSKPVENAWKFVISTSLNSCLDVIPLFFPLLVGSFMLMLYIKEPDGDDAKCGDYSS
ncbi:MAG: hypothetical protein R2778_06270 [Saprospiraceae bacterium]